MSDSNRVAIGIVPEVTFGTTPATPAFENLRTTAPSLTYTPKTGVSNELRADRQITDLILLGTEAAGQINFEMSYNAQDTLLEAALFSAWVAKQTHLNVTADSSITDAGTVANTYAVNALGANYKLGQIVQASGFTNAANNQVFRVASSTATTVVGTALGLTAETAPPAGARLRVVGFAGASGDITATTVGGNALLATALDFTTLGLVIGEWIKIGGTAVGDQFAGTAANNGMARISAITATRLSLDIVPLGWATDAAAAKTIKVWVGDYLRNGVTEKSFTIERQFQDHSPITYEYFRGMEISAYSMSFDAQAIATGSCSFSGRDAISQDSGRFAGATDVLAPTASVLNTSANVGRIAEGGVAVVGPNYVMAATIDINNNLRQQPAVGSLGAVGIGVGEFGVTGRLNTYFGNDDLYQKVLNNTASSYDIKLIRTDASGQMLLFDLPQIKFSGGSPAVPGKNADVMADLQYQAYRHATLGYTMQAQRFPYSE